jgi:L-ascorbate metabolism protein UlaG (beta-lactamase superfamily)
MDKTRAKITYLVHSGFSVETANHFFLFDYCPSMDRPVQITSEMLKTKQRIYIFASHAHGDHFDPQIFNWAESVPEITYILSSDISSHQRKINTHVMSAYEEWSDREMSVKTFGSTDEGISFLVKADGLSIFHAGDLNWWRWSGESKAEQDYADRIFKEEIDKLTGHKIDIAFFPVDRRLEENFALGAEYFAAKLQPRLLVPMHFSGDFGATRAFAELAKKTALPTVEITRKGQEILF